MELPLLHPSVSQAPQNSNCVLTPVCWAALRANVHGSWFCSFTAHRRATTLPVPVTVISITFTVACNYIFCFYRYGWRLSNKLELEVPCWHCYCFRPIPIDWRNRYLATGHFRRRIPAAGIPCLWCQRIADLRPIRRCSISVPNLFEMWIQALVAINCVTRLLTWLHDAE